MAVRLSGTLCRRGLVLTAMLLSTAWVVHQSPAWVDAPSLPHPVSNNALVAVDTREGPAVLSFLGLGPSKTWDGIGTDAFRWTLGDSAWTQLTPVPGPGRLAGTAQSVGGRVYLFGGYTVAEDGSEQSLPNVDIYDPDTDSWSRGADMPLPVDDAVSGVWRDSLIFLVSGWHDAGDVDRVQIYDPGTDTWRMGTPIPGVPVFGHTGAVAADAIVYVGGARVTGGNPRYTIESMAWRGDIDPDDPTRIAWHPLDPDPGPSLYRAAGGAVGGVVLFAGGSRNPYNYDGLGYDGVPSEPEAGVFGYDVNSGDWLTLQALTVPTMDHRNLAVAGGRLVMAGGMTAGQTVTDRVSWTEVSALALPPAGDLR